MKSAKPGWVKKLARARMERTGESYVTALHAVLAESQKAREAYDRGRTIDKAQRQAKAGVALAERVPRPPREVLAEAGIPEPALSRAVEEIEAMPPWQVALGVAGARGGSLLSEPRLPPIPPSADELAQARDHTAERLGIVPGVTPRRRIP